MTQQHPEQDQTTIIDMIAAARREAVHLETRDAYTPDDPVFADWQAGKPIDAVERWRDWYEVVKAAVGRGLRIRRARIVSEPITDFIRYEYDLTGAMNLGAGEEVRWLPRRQASDLLVPVNDFWVVDGALVRFSHFAGDGRYLDDEVSDDPAIAQMCATAFEAVWSRAIDHAEYQPK
ncbi:DUF6879 family protein [Nonomuraea sp. NPDC003754]